MVYVAAMTKPRRHLKIPTTLAYAKGGYSAALNLGSHEQPLNVLLDTGSSTLAVTDTRYDPSRDTLLRSTALAQQVTYGKGAWAGPVLHTQIGFGDRDDFRRVSDAPFAFVQSDAGNFFRDADGILGLAYRHLNPAHDMSEDLRAQGLDPPLTWPWPFRLDDDDARRAFKHELLQQPRIDLQPLFCALEEDGIVADMFSLQIGRSVVHVLEDGEDAGSLARNPLNSGVLVIGGGEECQSLYHGGFQDIRLVHEKYYNANLVSVQVGDNEPFPAPPLDADDVAGYCSNAIIDSGSSFIVLENSLYRSVLDAFAAHDARLPKLVAAFRERFQDEHGLPNDEIDFADWPTLRLRLEGFDGESVSLRCEPAHYWQRNAYRAGESLFLLLPQIEGWPRQSILGLPLLSGRYCIFDRRGSGRVRIAAARRD